MAKTISEMGRELQAVRERVTQLETQREADRAEVRAERAERQKQIGGQGGDGKAGS